MLQREKLLTPGFHTPTALTEICRSSVVWETWTDIGDVGAGRRSDLTRNDTNRQISTSLGWNTHTHTDPVSDTVVTAVESMSSVTNEA